MDCIHPAFTDKGRTSYDMVLYLQHVTTFITCYNIYDKLQQLKHVKIVTICNDIHNMLYQLQRVTRYNNSSKVREGSGPGCHVHIDNIVFLGFIVDFLKT